MKLKQIEINQTGDLYFACYVYRMSAETEYEGDLHNELDDYGLHRQNCVAPHYSKTYVFGEARKAAEKRGVSLINLVDLSAGVPLVESYAKMTAGAMHHQKIEGFDMEKHIVKNPIDKYAKTGEA